MTSREAEAPSFFLSPRGSYVVTSLSFLCLCCYLFSLLNVEMISHPLAPDFINANLVGRALFFPCALIFATGLLLATCIDIFRAMRKGRKANALLGPRTTMWAAHRQDLVENHSRWALYLARLGLLALAVIGIQSTCFFPYLLVGAWISLGMLAACLAYVSYFWQNGPAACRALRHRTLYNLRLALLLLPCYLLLVEVLMHWGPEQPPSPLFLLPCLALCWFGRAKVGPKLKYYTGSQPPHPSTWPSLGWTAALCLMLIPLSLFEMDQHFSSRNIPHGFFVLLLLLLPLLYQLKVLLTGAAWGSKAPSAASPSRRATPQAEHY